MSDTLDIGKLPPQATDIEELVIGAIMLEKGAMDKVISVLVPEDFYKSEHQHMYYAAMGLQNKGKPIDILTVTEELKKSKMLDSIGGPYEVSKMTNRVASSENIEYHAYLIKQKSMQREVIISATNSIKDSYDDRDVFDTISDLQDTLRALTNIRTANGAKGITQMATEFQSHVERARKNAEDGKVSGVPTTLRGVDRITNGWQDTDLIIVAARPGMGKTAFTKACIQGAIQQLQEPVGMFSMEMSSLQLLARFASEDMEMASQRILAGDYDASKMNNLWTKFYGEQERELLIIDDTSGLTAQQAVERAKRMHDDHECCMYIFDYIQLMEGSGKKGQNREQEISEITRTLKLIAKELNVPVIALSQLNRAVETRGGDKKPQLSDLRDSGAIEQDADLVSFLYRPEYYGITEAIVGGNPVDTAGLGELIIAKHRNGALTSIPLTFTDYLTKFEDYEQPF